MSILQVQGDAFRNFSLYIRSEVTKRDYISRFKIFMQYCRVKNADELLYKDHKRIQSLITDYLVHLKIDKTLSYTTVQAHYTAIHFFYTMNDILDLNWSKIRKAIGEEGKRIEDRPYKTEEIARMLEKCDQRGKIIILLMASSGIRQGSIASLKINHLEKVQGVYQITVYKNTPQQYITFCSYECTNAIDDYLNYRKRYGEKIVPAAPLIREQFDKRFPYREPRHLTTRTIARMIYFAINDAGIREKQNIVKGQKKIQHEVMQSHGLRKYFETQVILGGMDLFHAELLMGHKTGLALKSYVKLTPMQMLEEYLKVVDNLTIDPANRLRREVEHYKVKASQFDSLRAEIDQLKEIVRSK
jgi:integrase